MNKRDHLSRRRAPRRPRALWWVCALAGAPGLVRAQAGPAPEASRVVLATVASAQAGQPAGAAPAVALPAALTLEEFLQLVLTRSPDLDAERLNIEAARGDTLAAGTWPNPVLSASRKPGEKELGIEQPLPIFGQVTQRKATARQAERQAEADTAEQVAKRLGEAGDAFVDAQMAEQRERVWAQAQQQMREALRIVQGQITAGARSRYDGERMALKLSQLDVSLSRARAERLTVAGRMGTLVAAPTWQPRALGPLHPPPDDLYADATALWAQARERVPALQAAGSAVELANQQLALQRKEALPTPSVSLARVRNRQEGHYNQVGVSIELPLFDRKQGEIARAKAELQQARYRRTAAEVEAEAQVLQSVQQYRLRRDALLAFEQHERDQHGNLATMADDAYRLGQSSILDYIDSLETLRERQMDKLALVEDMLRAQWTVRQAIGQLPVLPPQ